MLSCGIVKYAGGQDVKHNKITADDKRYSFHTSIGYGGERKEQYRINGAGLDICDANEEFVVYGSGFAISKHIHPKTKVEWQTRINNKDVCHQDFITEYNKISPDVEKLPEILSMNKFRKAIDNFLKVFKKGDNTTEI